MAKVRRIIQKVEPVAEPGFEQQFWPVVIALCVLGGFVYGASLALLDGVWLWTSLIAVPIVVFSLILILNFVDSRWLRRSVQLAIILSLVFHIALLIIAHFTNIFSGVFEEERVAQVAEKKPLIVKKYVNFDPKPWREVKKDEVKLEDIEEVTKREIQPETTQQQPQPTPVPNPQQQPQKPVVEKKQKPVETVPRRNVSLSRLSRQNMQVQPKSGTAAEAVETKSAEKTLTAKKTELKKKGESNAPSANVKEAPQKNPSKANPQVVQKRSEQQPDKPTDAVQQPRTSLMKRSQQLTANVGANTKVKVETPKQSKQRTTKESLDKTRIETQQATSQSKRNNQAVKDVVVPDTIKNPLMTQRTKRTTDTKSDSTQKPAQLARASANLSPTVPVPQVSSSKTDSPTSQKSRPDKTSSETALKPAKTTVAQQQPAKTVTPTKQTPREVKAELTRNPKTDVAVARRPNRTQQPKVTQSNASVLQRNPTSNPSLSARTKTDIQTNKQEAVVKSNSPQPSPTSTQIARQPTRSQNSNNSRQPSTEVTSSPHSQVAKAVPRRNNATAPSINTNTQASTQPRRSMNVAATAQSSTNAENPSRSSPKVSEGKGTPQVTALALSRSESGTTGKGSSANLMSDSPAPNRPSLQASGARQRTEATRNTPRDNALSPSSSASVPRTAAGQVMPRSSLMADNSPNPTKSGETQPSSLTANASPATIDAASNAKTAAVSADAGSTSIDLGPTKIVSESSSNERAASGGGQPNMNTPSEASTLDRASLASGSVPSLSTSVRAEDTAAPESTDSGQPQPNDNDLDATSMVKLDVGANQPTTTGPSNALTEGPSSDVSSAPQPSTQIAARAERAESTPGDPAEGGGTPTDDASAKLIRAELTGGPSTSSVALIEDDEEEGTPRSDMTGPQTLVADSAGIDAPSAETAASDAGSSVLQKLAGGVTGGEHPSRTADLSGGSPTSRASKGEQAISDSDGALAASSISRQGIAPSISTSVSADDAGDLATAASGSASSAGESSLAATDVNIQAASGGSVAGGKPGGSEGPMTTDVAANIGAADGQRATSGNRGNDGPQGSQSGGRLGRHSLAGDLASNTSADVSDMDMETGDADAGSTNTGQLDGLANVQLGQRSATGGEAVEIDAELGPGGMGTLAATESGLNSRRARNDHGPLQAFSIERFHRNNPGGIPTFNKTAVFASRAFTARGEREFDASGAPTTEEAIDLGLQYLAQVQQENGRWILEHDLDSGTVMHSDTAATGLALLAFQGAGYNHHEYKYADQLDGAINWLVDHQQKDGSLYVESDEHSNAACRLYSHGIAALALCEAYGMTQDPLLKKPAQLALDFITKSQSKQHGGWRYAVGDGESDTSVTGWMMMAIKSGRLAGLRVDKETDAGIQRWLDTASMPDQAFLYRYNPYAEDEEGILRSHGRKPSHCMTSVGLLMRLYSGWNRDTRQLIDGADYLLEKLPSDESSQLRDTYYWYYATQVLRHVGGERWEKWNSKLHPLLIGSQVQNGQMAGSWNPMGPIPDRWGAFGGRLYVTSMNLLSLEVDYRLLPLYDKTVQSKDD